MIEIELTPEERTTGTLSPSTIERARRAILDEGYVVLLDVADPAHIAKVRDRMIEDIPHILARPDKPFNWNPGNLQQDPPPLPEYLFEDILLNDFVLQVTESIMGPGVQNGFYSGNTAMPKSTQRQPVHADIGHLWPNMEHATPPYALVVNFPLVDMGPENGATEIWPGTHKDTSIAMSDGDIKVTEEQLAKWRAIHPPIQPKVRAGSALIRDIRMWHAGMPNPSDHPRPMAALIHWVGWWHLEPEMAFPKSAEPFFQKSRLRTVARFVDDSEFEYLNRTGAYEYTAETSEV